MAARLLRLRLTLLGSAFRGSATRALRAVLIGLLAAAAAVALAWLPTLLLHEADARADLDVFIGSALLGAALLVPFFANRGHLEPRQFASVPARPGSIASALLFSTVLTWPAILLLVWLVALAALRPEWQQPIWALVVGIALAYLFALIAARVSSALSKLWFGHDRGGVLRVVGTVLLIAILPLAFFGVTAISGAPEGSTAAAARALGWSPFGAAFAGAQQAASGDPSAALLHFGVVLAGVLVLLVIWFPIVRASLQSVERPADPAIARRGLGWFERFSAKPASVIAARVLTYWSRDPRYRVGLSAIPFVPVLMILAFWVAGADLRTLAAVPLPVILLLLAWSLHNDVAMDSTAIWSHVASGIAGRDDRRGRLAPVLLIGLPVALIGSTVTVTVMGEWRVLPAVIGMNLAVLLVTCGVSSVFSVLIPYPTTRPGDSPFAQPQWSGSGSGLSQTLSMIAALVFSVPAVWIAVVALVDVTPMWNLAALAFGVVYGVGILGLGILLGGKIFDRRGPELIAATQVFD